MFHFGPLQISDINFENQNYNDSENNEEPDQHPKQKKMLKFNKNH